VSPPGDPAAPSAGELRFAGGAAFFAVFLAAVAVAGSAVFFAGVVYFAGVVFFAAGVFFAAVFLTTGGGCSVSGVLVERE
jgi:hypothetical protein